MYKNKAVYSAYPWSSDFNVACFRQVSGMLQDINGFQEMLMHFEGFYGISRDMKGF